MPLDKLDGRFVVKTRDRIRDDYLRDFKSRVPTADTTPKSQVYVDASTFADAQLPLYFDASLVADATARYSAKGKDLDKEGELRGRPRKGATGASGYVIANVASGGALIVADSELRYTAQGTRFRVITTGTYNNGDLIAVTGISTGPSTNVDAGTALTWVNPAPGVAPTALVFENADGSGLTGGRNAETDEEYAAALYDLEANPPQSGNPSAVILEASRIPGLALEKAFVYPAIDGPGTYGVAFTMRPSVLGGSRLPNGAQIAIVEEALKAAFPGDDGIMVASLLDDDVDVCLEVTWGPGAAGWADVVPWPAYAVAKVVVEASPAPTATTFRLDNCTTAPTAGKTIGFYDSTTRSFKRKRILTATFVAGDSYDIVVDSTTTGASDTSFVPAAGAIVSPWSNSLDDLVDPVLTYFGRQGPGEQVATFYDVGLRQRRTPEPTPAVWPSSIENRLVEGLFSVVSDADLVLPAPPFPTTVGTPGTLAYLHRLGDFGVFEQ